jgi:hypothetical protein
LQYKQVASLQRDALEELSNKTLKFLIDDPSYHTRLAEFNETTRALDERYARVLDQLEAERKLKAEYFQKRLVIDEDYTIKQHEVKLHNLYRCRHF